MTAPTAGSTPPRTIAGRYRLDRMLGRGAMGAVWEAEDTVLRRPVAVKEVLLPHGLAPAERAVACERTLREARAIARLQHPNVVTLFDVLDEDGRPWVVMELVPARSLAQLVREEGTVTPFRAASIGVAVLGALEAAHAAGITHRDVKPGNILIADDGRTKLTDFGIARSAEDSALTSTGLLLGSPSYIAPEVVRGAPAGPPADLFGLGATLYAAVEGRPPFRGDDPISTLNAVASLAPEPYRMAGPLAPVLDGLLRKDPATRLSAGDARRMLAEVSGESDGGYLGPPGPGHAGPNGPAGGPGTPVGPTGWAQPPGPVHAQPVLGPPTLPPSQVGVVTPPAGVPIPPYAPAPAAAQYGGYPTGHGGPGRADMGRAPNTAPPFDMFADGMIPSGYEPEPRSPGKVIAAVVAGALCLALVIGGVVLVKNVLNGTDNQTPPRGGGQQTTSAPPTQKPTGPAAIPNGYDRYQNPNGTYSVGVPTGWTTRRTSKTVIEVDNPDDRTQFLRFLSSNGSDPLGELSSEEPGFAGSHSGYQKINLGNADYRGLPAADWEFTFTKDGATRHVLYRLFLQSGHLYGIYVSAPEESFAAVRHHFDVAAATFTTAN